MDNAEGRRGKREGIDKRKVLRNKLGDKLRVIIGNGNWYFARGRFYRRVEE